MFRKKIYAKWILAGEHAVLRGQPALVLPIQQCYLEMEYENGAEELLVQCDSDQGEQLQVVVLGLLDKALLTIGEKRSDIRGYLRLTNRVSLAGGMGASATLCVMIARLLEHLSYISEDKIYDTAKGLEDLFHGESSGVDVSCAIMNKPLTFRRPADIQPFVPQWKPNWYLSHCGKRGVTAECVSKVKALWETDRDKAERVDLQMTASFNAGVASLDSTAPSLEREQKLIESLHLSADCFAQWDLISTELDEHMRALKSRGALAVKPTGSGDGGFVVSLWPEGVAPTGAQSFITI